jgi:SAM-dependent methyltransferase
MAVPEWWLPVLQRMTGLPDLAPRSLQRFVPTLRELSAHLNECEARRTAPVAYMRDRGLRESYLLYYVTSNFLKPDWPLGEIWPAGPPASAEPFRILDIGCGPGTGVAALHAWCDRVHPARPLSVRGIDSVEANASLYREMGRVLRAHTGHAVDCTAVVGDALRLEGESRGYDLLMGMNVLNELHPSAHARFLARCAELLMPGGKLLLIEPALRATSRGLLALRDKAVQEGWTVELPCFRQDACPALAGEKDWCHHDIAWERPDFIAWLDEEIGTIKRSLKFSCIVLHREEAATRWNHEGPSPLRVVSELFEEKGRSWCHACGAGGRRVYQRNRRDRSDANALFDELRRYDAILLEGETDRAHDVRISAECRVHRYPRG